MIQDNDKESLLQAQSESLAEPRSEHPTLRRGSSGPWVKHLQDLLNKHGAQMAADGQFGPHTHNVVRFFQGANGLTTDGIVGPLTWAKLHAPRQPPVPRPPGPF